MIHIKSKKIASSNRRVPAEKCGLSDRWNFFRRLYGTRAGSM
jgi:hypothetical protein